MQATATKWSFETAWLSGAKFDLTFIVGIFFLAVFSGAIVWYDNDLFAPVLFLDLWFLGYHHVISTFTKLAGTPDDRRENRFLIYYLPFLVVAAVGVLGLGVGVWMITTIYFFWQWYHYVRQSYGISAFYRRKAEVPVEENERLSHAALWSIPVTGLLYRCHQGWDQFLFQDFWAPSIPFFVVAISALITTALVLYWALTRFVAFQKGTLPLGQTLFTASHFGAFYIGYIYITDINIGWLVANIWHNAQYILFVWLYNTKRFGNPDSKDAGTVIAWASQVKPIRILAYFVGCLLITTVFYKSVMLGLDISVGANAALLGTLYIVTFQTMNFHHYIVDSMIWKARKKKHQDVMQLKQTGA